VLLLTENTWRIAKLWIRARVRDKVRFRDKVIRGK